LVAYGIRVEEKAAPLGRAVPNPRPSAREKPGLKSKIWFYARSDQGGTR